MSLDKLNAGAVGQVDDSTFVQRLYQDSHVRFRMMGCYEGDNHVANTVECRKIMGAGNDDVEFKTEVFGTTLFEYDKAAAVFKAWVKNYIDNLVLPQ